ncbi:peptidyl-prolyl cis-trans isomerase E-like isoform X2 [Photinus pyralis]|uniref:peptidyl-prolyl cis-trans isomerase E-like isoform X2 n=1 Tax=Photinus pyralis TaxID=7054 RepID=UPI0012676791|nr:peptidyl-prolyl cis-trans isomerase E-like isoform X2 [Photinus pyralis]
MKKKSNKFKPFLKSPRYLVGQVDQDTIISDLRNYNNHRYQLFTAKPRIDTKPLPMNPHKYVNSQRLVNDRFRMSEINRQNRAMIQKINVINRNGGWIDTFNPIAYSYRSRWRAHELNMKEIERTNIKSEYETKELDENWKHVVEKLRNSSKYPCVLLDKKSLDYHIRQQPSISSLEDLEKNERPKVFMDFRVKDGAYLGRIIIELYSDYVPVTVQNFISLCCKLDGLTYKNCQVHRVAPGKYVETGDITKGNGKGGTSIYGETFPEENHRLKHTKMGVLSMVPVRNGLNNSQFSITFTAIEKFDDTRVVFGKVIKGNTTLCKLNDLGKPFGRPIAPILINNCGKYTKGKTPSTLRKFKY